MWKKEKKKNLKENVKQHFRVTIDWYLMELTIMNCGARVRPELDERRCETPVHQKKNIFDGGWCEFLHCITNTKKEVSLMKGITIEEKNFFKLWRMWDLHDKDITKNWWVKMWCSKMLQFLKAKNEDGAWWKKFFTSSMAGHGK